MAFQHVLEQAEADEKALALGEILHRILVEDAGILLEALEEAGEAPPSHLGQRVEEALHAPALDVGQEVADDQLGIGVFERFVAVDEFCLCVRLLKLFEPCGEAFVAHGTRGFSSQHRTLLSLPQISSVIGRLPCSLVY